MCHTDVSQLSRSKYLTGHCLTARPPTYGQLQDDIQRGAVLERGAAAMLLVLVNRISEISEKLSMGEI